MAALAGELRIPLRTHVVLRHGSSPALVGFSFEVSRESIGLVLPAAAPGLAPGSRVELSLAHPGASVSLCVPATVSEVRSLPSRLPACEELVCHRIRLAFERNHPAARQIACWVQATRHRVLCLGVAGISPSSLPPPFELILLQSHSEFVANNHLKQVSAIVIGPGFAPTQGGVLELVHGIRVFTRFQASPVIVACGIEDPTTAQSLLEMDCITLRDPSTSAADLDALLRGLLGALNLASENARLLALLREGSALTSDPSAAPRCGTRPGRLPELVGRSEAARRLVSTIERIAGVDALVLIQGETGAGKGVVARALHRLSTHADRQFLAINCASLPDALLDAELFGHVRGAFTHAFEDRAGLFEAASGGTLFLDEVSEMSPAMQAKLLLVLQDHEVRRVGATRTVRVDARVICATNRDLSALVREGRFREDLLYRLRTFMISVPPLRERRDDIAELASQFLDGFARQYGRPQPALSREALAVLESAEWPGNVRELAHVIERLVVMTPEQVTIDAAMVREAMGLPPATGALAPPASLKQNLRDRERAIIVDALERADGIIAEAARTLGIERSTLSRRCKRLGVTPTPVPFGRRS